MKSGKTSRKYHPIRLTVLLHTFFSVGQRRGGSSMKKVGRSPGRKRAMRVPAATKMPSMMRAQSARAAGCPARRPRMTPICAAQGMLRASRKVAMTRSRLVSRIRVTMVAMVSHPKPRTRGITARPLRPMPLKRRSSIMARRGR